MLALRTGILASSILALASCRTPDFLPSNFKLPKTWLQTMVSIREVEEERDRYYSPNHPSKERWKPFFALLQTGDEIWHWESPEQGNITRFGVCIVRNNNIIYVLQVSLHATIY